MKTYFKKLIIFGLPLTIVAFCLLTAKADQLCDGDHFTAYGFPFFWTTPGTTSLAPATDIALFVIDIAVYFVFFAGLSATRLFDRLLERKAIVAGAVLWIAAILVGGWFGFVLFYFGHQDGIFVADCQQRNYRPHLGFPLGGSH
ncbi:MAG TPA: hypothetical protein VHQ01_13070 [Pyrinomonadaceae bacterium]|nr:hypothetical protein [Pyrinomonadaceae bacterium]